MLGLDVLTFNALVTLMTRIEYRRMAEKTWASATASGAAFSGDSSNLKRLTEAWTNPESINAPRKPDAAGIEMLASRLGAARR